MTITFKCGQCGVQHKTGDEMAGKRARCKCGTIVDVPSPRKSAPSSTAVTCGGCGKQHATTAAMAGKRAQCDCGAIINIPAASTSQPPVLSSGNNSAQVVQCGGCGKQHQTTPQMAGKRAQCDCGAVLQIPHAAVVNDLSSAPAGDLSSLLDDLPAPQSPSPWQQQSFGQAPSPWQQQPANTRPSEDQILSQYAQSNQWREENNQSEDYSGAFGFEQRILNSSVIGGAVAMLAAAVWFIAGLAAGFIFFYPPILFVLGLIGVMRGIFSGIGDD